MERTTIMLPHDLKEKAVNLARLVGISLGRLIRESLEIALTNDDPKNLMDDPIFREDEVFCGKAPADLSQNHDRYLYGNKN